jgi:hypothetical protein
MFGKLKEKLKNWTKKISEETEEIEEPKEKKPKKIKVKLEKEIPLKFNVGAKKYEPDLEKIKEIAEEAESEPGTETFFEKITSKVKKIKISEK